MLQHPDLSTLRFSDLSPLPRKDSSGRTTFDPAYVRDLFNSIAHRYDLLNHVLSSGIDVLWRKKAIRLLRPYAPQRILDVATGTGDLALEAARQLSPARIVGLDVAGHMLSRGRSKAERKGFGPMIEFLEGSAEHLPFEQGVFDAALCGFGVRNFSDLEQGLSEMHRVLSPGGSIVILEFSRPEAGPVRRAYEFYSRTALPVIGRWISGNPEAYSYLPETIREFPSGDEFLAILSRAGFQSLKTIPLTFGIAAIYHGIK